MVGFGAPSESTLNSLLVGYTRARRAFDSSYVDASVDFGACPNTCNADEIEIVKCSSASLSQCAGNKALPLQQQHQAVRPNQAYLPLLYHTVSPPTIGPLSGPSPLEIDVFSSTTSVTKFVITRDGATPECSFTDPTMVFEVTAGTGAALRAFGDTTLRAVACSGESRLAHSAVTVEQVAVEVDADGTGVVAATARIYGLTVSNYPGRIRFAFREAMAEVVGVTSAEVRPAGLVSVRCAAAHCQALSHPPANLTKHPPNTQHRRHQPDAFAPQQQQQQLQLQQRLLPL